MQNYRWIGCHVTKWPSRVTEILTGVCPVRRIRTVPPPETWWVWLCRRVCEIWARRWHVVQFVNRSAGHKTRKKLKDKFTSTSYSERSLHLFKPTLSRISYPACRRSPAETLATLRNCPRYLGWIRPQLVQWSTANQISSKAIIFSTLASC